MKRVTVKQNSIIEFYFMLIIGLGFLGVFTFNIFNEIRNRIWPQQAIQQNTDGDSLHTSINITEIDTQTGKLKYRLLWLGPINGQVEGRDGTCITRIDIYYMEPGNKQEDGNFTQILEKVHYFDAPVCQVNSGPRPKGPTSNDQELTGTVMVGHDRYFYPYDEVQIGIHVDFYGYYIVNGSNMQTSEIPGNIIWDVYFPGWELKNISSRERFFSPRDDKKYDVLRITLIRPTTYRIITPIIIILLFVFILLIPLIKDLGSLAQIVTGMIFSLWSGKQLLMFPDVQWMNILDTVFVFLYISLGFSVLSNLLLLLIKKFDISDDKLSDTEITFDLNKKSQNKSDISSNVGKECLLLLMTLILFFIGWSISSKSQKTRRPSGMRDEQDSHQNGP